VGDLSGVEDDPLSASGALLRRGPFRLLWSGQVISNFGDALTSLALLLTAHHLTGSTAAVAGVAIALALPQLLFGMAAGVLVDRWNRRRVMIVSDLVRAVLVLGFLAVTSADTLWLLYALAFVQAAVGTFFNPARAAVLPEIVPADRLLSANALSETSRVVAGMAGVAAAGALAGLTGRLGLVFVVDAATFVASAALIARLPGMSATAARATRGVWADLADGVRLVLGSRRLVGVIVAATVVMLGLGAVNVLLVPFVVEVLDASETWFGALEAAQVASMVLAGGALVVVGARFRPTTLISAGLVGVGLVVAAMAASTRPWHLMGLLFAVGWCVAPVQASVTTILQTEVPAHSRGRAHASFGSMVGAAGLASMAVAGAVAEAVGIRLVLIASGGVIVGAGLASAAVFRSVAKPQHERKEQNECPPSEIKRDDVFLPTLRAR
jgi:MFS family permease